MARAFDDKTQIVIAGKINSRSDISCFVRGHCVSARRRRPSVKPTGNLCPRRMVAQVERIATALDDLPADATYIYLNAQLDAMSLYAKFGFTAEGEQFQEAGIQHFKMVKKV